MADSGLKAMKWMVISLGILLIGGSIMLGVALYQKLNAPQTETCELPVIPEGGRISAIDSNGHHLTLLLDMPDGTQRYLITKHRCTNQTNWQSFRYGN